MKTRIISAAVMIAIVISALVAGKLWSPVVITAFIAALTAIAVFELIHNALSVKKPSFSVVPMIYGMVMVFLLDKNLFEGFDGKTTEFIKVAPLFLSVIYFLFAVCICLKGHKELSLDGILGITAYPFFIAYAFSCLSGIISFNKGIYYLLLLINFASICDTGAYFVGSFFGKHKLCPEISPKKTVEGAFGGIGLSLVVSLILAACYGSMGHLGVTLVMTVLLCIVGMLGDLFASIIKRRAGIKDYGSLIPGHGGILDRFDSMLLIAPVLYMFMESGVI
ncbi:MAG TPA: hypothetical protein DEW35_03140 [Ruminococcaceae bacterium]|nr:hypothetical protein [Oscillospiraceae bacterium]